LLYILLLVVAQFDTGITADRVVSCEIQADNHGYRVMHLSGKVHQEVHLGAALVGGEEGYDLLADGRSAECVLVDMVGVE